jgi:predicted transposase YdaD
MTIADRIRAEEREETREATMEFATFEYVKGLIEKGLDANFIADAFKLPVKKVQDIIKKIKESSN